MEENALGGHGAGRLWYNVTCHNDVKQAMFRSRPLDPVSLNVGLPGGNHQLAEDKLWTFIHIVQNAWVDANGDVHSCDVTIVPSRCINASPVQKHGGTEYDEVFTISQYWGEGFYHSTLENLPRLAPYFGFLTKHPNIKIHVARQALMVDLTHVLPGISHRLVTGAVRGKLVYSPAGGPCGRSPILTTQLLSLFLRMPLPNIPQSRNEIIVIKRSQKRFFSNHDAIVEMLSRESAAYGLTVSVFSDNPLPHMHTTRSLFNQALLVVAPHGAGEANLLYSQSGTVLVEGLCYNTAQKANLCYRNMAHALGMRYHGLIFHTQCNLITAQQIQEPIRIILQNMPYL